MNEKFEKSVEKDMKQFVKDVLEYTTNPRHRAEILEYYVVTVTKYGLSALLKQDPNAANMFMDIQTLRASKLVEGMKGLHKTSSEDYSN